MRKHTKYYPNGDKLLTEEYFYRNNVLKATELLTYDTLQESKSAGGYVYIYYDNGKPFQRVRLFGFPNKNVRLLDEFKFENQKVVRQKTTAVGYGPDMDSLLNGMKDKDVLIQSYQYKDTMYAKQIFKDLYKLQEESETYYDADGYPKKTIVTNTAGKVIVRIEHEYSDGQCTKKVHWVPQSENNELVVYKTEYFTYDEGLISMHIIEENGVQTVLEYTHFAE